MRKLFFVLIASSLFALNGCDDGDVITVELDFDNIFEICEGGDDMVLYKTKEDPSESLSLQFSDVSIEDILNVDDDGIYEKTITISSSNPFYYRTYSNSSLPDDLFCEVIPNSEVVITNDTEVTSGSAYLLTVLIEDDDDGIPADLENRDPNGDGDYSDAQDTDGDGLPDYLDADDDGDNVLTKTENPDPDGDEDLSDAQDTDGDGTPDYLDTDDDGDGVATRNEENDTQDQDPTNDFSTSEVADYLNKVIDDNIFPATAYREHTIEQTYTVTLTIYDVDLDVISLDTFAFGVLENDNTEDSRTVTPDFP